VDIVTGIAAATEALKLTKELRDIDRQIDKAELKLRLIDLVDRLLEAKEALQDAKEDRRALLDKISELEHTLARKPRLRDESGRLYEIDEGGNAVGNPYCNLCLVRENKLYRLIHHRATEHIYAFYRCQNCESTVDG
jgi:hypothetical protein